MTTSSISTKTQNMSPSHQNTVSTYASGTNGSNNRLQFNRLAAERKTVHVMNANLNKDVSKRDRQILASYNNNGSGTGTVGSTSGGNANTNLTNAQNYQNNYSGNEYGMMSTGRSQTNASSFLQKLSSKFTRR